MKSKKIKDGKYKTRDEIWELRNQIEFLKKKEKYNQIKPLQKTLQKARKRLRKIERKAENICEICELKSYPLSNYEGKSLCTNCRIKSDIFDKIREFLHSYKKNVILASSKPERCCICDALPHVNWTYDDFEQFKECYVCKRKICKDHFKEIHIDLRSEFYTNKTSILSVKGILCEKCNNKLPEMIYVDLYKFFGEYLKEHLEEFKLERIKRKKRIKELKE